MWAAETGYLWSKRKALNARKETTQTREMHRCWIAGKNERAPRQQKSKVMNGEHYTES